MSIFGNMINEQADKRKELLRESKQLVDKWEKSSLLEGLTDKRSRQNMARLFENQAAELLNEATTMSNGDVEGFASVAFPLIRRVFGELIAEELVSVQPMKLPAGLVFFLDFTFANTRQGIYTKGDSIYGGNKVGVGVTEGVEIDDLSTGFYYNQSGYSSPTVNDYTITGVAAGAIADSTAINPNWTYGAVSSAAYDSVDLVTQNTEVDVLHDVQVLNDGSTAAVAVYEYRRYTVQVTQAVWDRIDLNNTMGLNLLNIVGAGFIDATTCTVIRRLTTMDSTNRRFTFVVRTLAADVADMADCSLGGTNYLSYNVNDKWDNGTSLGSIISEDWHMEGPFDKDTKYGGSYAWEEMPEIDIKINSLEITAKTKKLKAKWSPELGQDLSAFHNLDAEVELTGVLSEHIALEIDREILNDLVQGATAGKLYWSRRPGIFLNRTTGQVLTGPEFTGNVSEWYETLLEVVGDLSATIHRKTLRGGANFIVCGPELANVLEFTSGFRASISAPDAKTGTAGVYKEGTISKKLDIYVDPYFPRNLMLVGRKGTSFLETGYVYSPYVPLQTSPVIYGPEDLVPRKGVMTRFAKKMVRPDMYGTVVVRYLRN